MIEDKIHVRFIDKNLKLKVIEESVQGLNYVEQLVDRILNKEGVGPVYRCLFALRLVNELIWLAPSANLKVILRWSHENTKTNDGPPLELRMRFQPANYARLALLDGLALSIIFAQVRTDFLWTRFNDEKRALLLLSEPVVAMVVLDLIRHSIEHDIKIDKILDRVNQEDFLPQRASSWQRDIIFHVANLKKALLLGYEQCNKDIQTLKRKYIELFLTKVAVKYGTETYIAQQLPQSTNIGGDSPIDRSVKLRLRVRFFVKGDATHCVVETAEYNGVRIGSMLQNKKNVAADCWTQICDIETINHATLRYNMVQLARDNDLPVRYQFKTGWHAESFLSLLDGYYRLMRKWNLNISRDIWSPSLLRLKQLESHGPIGFESARRKLTEFERPGDFIVRQCINVNDRYLIDTTLLDAKVILTIHVDWCQQDRKFRQNGHSMNRDGFEVVIKTAETEYLKLRQMIRDIEISVMYKSQGLFRKQLKHWIQPEDDDHYPSLLLSMSEKKLEQLEEHYKSNLNGSIGQLPHIIPQQFLKAPKRRFANSNNGMSVELAVTADDRDVIVKDFQDVNMNAYSGSTGDLSRKSSRECFAFHVCQEGHVDRHADTKIDMYQVRIADWAFVKSHLFAETIGYVISGALVQEYFPIGRLDDFLKANQQLDRLVRLSISFQLIQALLYLYQKKIIHGKIRCHNVMVKKLHPMQIKLSDPLGLLDAEQDQAFIPPEYYSSTVGTCVKKFYSGVDVWAMGTTMWQIFNDGSRPPTGRYANTLTQPSNCSDDVWKLIEACWAVEPCSRATPQALFRDLCDLLAWEKGAHDYFYISPEDSETNNPDAPISTASQSTPSEHDTDRQLSQSMHTKNGNDGSQTHSIELTKNLAVPINHDTISTCSSGSGTTTTSRSDARMISNQANFRRVKWRNFMNLGKNQRPQQNNLPPRNYFSELFGSSSSLNSCTTPSGSDITRLTILDFENISDTLNRSVWQVESSRLKLGPEIGRGSSGVVMKGVLSLADGDKVVAVKCIDKNSSSFDVNHIDDLRREFEILKNLDHENIVKALGYVEESQMMLISEYMPLGSLLSCLKNLNNPDDLHKLPLQKYALDIARGMEYLEGQKIVHCDLALRNILLCSRNEVKICDFGLAKSLGPENFYKLKTERALPLKWYAPESVSIHVFTHKSDVWSYGVVLWEMYSGGDNPQYSGTYANLSETLKHERLPMPGKCPGHMYDLMLRCWAYKAEDRMAFGNIREVLEQPN